MRWGSSKGSVSVDIFNFVLELKSEATGASKSNHIDEPLHFALYDSRGFVMNYAL